MGVSRWLFAGFVLSSFGGRIRCGNWNRRFPLGGREQRQGRGQKGKCNRKGKNGSRFLHCAPHDETVRRSGRNDDSWVLVRENRQRQKQRQKHISAGSQKRTAKATATATGKADATARGCGFSSCVRRDIGRGILRGWRRGRRVRGRRRRRLLVLRRL